MMLDAESVRTVARQCPIVGIFAFLASPHLGLQDYVVSLSPTILRWTLDFPKGARVRSYKSKVTGLRVPDSRHLIAYRQHVKDAQFVPSRYHIYSTRFLSLTTPP